MVTAVARTFAPNPDFVTENVITELGIGEALVSALDEKGRPLPVQRTLIRPPESRIGPLNITERTEHLARSPVRGRYEEAVDRESAYEMLRERARQGAESRQDDSSSSRPPKSASNRRQSMGEALVKSAARSIGSQIGRQIGRGILGSLFGGRR